MGLQLQAAPASAGTKPPQQPHALPVDRVFEELDSSPPGLTTAQARLRLGRCGPNALQDPARPPGVLLLLRHVFDLFGLLLLGGAGLASLAHRAMPGEGYHYVAAALVAVVVLNATFTWLQERRSERILESFRGMMPSRVTVLRDGSAVPVDAREVVPGDVMLLDEGSRVPADGRLFEASALKVDNAALTGESEPQLRHLEPSPLGLLESRNMVFSGTLVLSGDGRAVVTATGMDSQIGRIVHLTREASTASPPLRREIEHFVRVISVLAASVGLLFFLVALALGKPWLAGAIYGVGLLVANLPEGLMPTVTLSLALCARRMARRNALVRTLEAVETLGCSTCICTDKTGTLTQSRMQVTTLVVDGRETPAPEVHFSEALRPAWEVMALCNNARGAAGDPTEVALRSFCEQVHPTQPSEALPRLYESPFDAARQRMITTHRAPDGRCHVLMKGAPERVLARCSHRWQGGRTAPMTDEDRAAAERDFRRLAGRGERVLAMAFKMGTEERPSEADFAYVGLVGLKDPPRPEVPDAIRRCRGAGIRVFMITGDHSLTAEAIALEIGLLDAPDGVVTGADVDRMEEAELEALLGRSQLVFARALPGQKLRIVRALQRRGDIVTVTGDGVNDAPALKHADLGVAMGRTGTDVAREASDLVLLDDNFATIVDAIAEGRAIFSNIRKFIAYILTSNVAEMLPFVAYVLLDIPLPLTILLMLAIDLGTDMLPAIGLGVEAPEDDLMRLPPRPRTERLLVPALLLTAYGVYGLLEGLGGLAAYWTVLVSGGWRWGEALGPGDPLYRSAVTALFAAVVIGQVASVQLYRTRWRPLLTVGPGSNRLVLAGIGVELALLAGIVYAPPLQHVFGTVSLAPWQLLLGVPFALLLVLVEEMRKGLARRRNPWVLRHLAW